MKHVAVKDVFAKQIVRCVLQPLVWSNGRVLTNALVQWVIDPLRCGDAIA